MKKHVSELIGDISVLEAAQATQAQTLCPRVTATVNALFQFFYVVCRGFEKQYHDPRRLTLEKTQWIKAFMDVGIAHIDDCANGVKQARLESPIFTPTIKQFIEWNDDLTDSDAFPSLENAYAEACKNSHFAQSDKRWSHPVVMHAWAQTGSWRLQNEPRAKTCADFKKNYNCAIKRYRKGALREQLEDKTKETAEIEREKDKQDKITKRANALGVNNYETAKKYLNNLLGKGKL